jgi:phosphate/sulfate permease
MDPRSEFRMSLMRALGTLASAFCVVLFAIFIGHGLSTYHAGPFIGASVLLALAAILVVFQVRMR